MTIRVLLVDDHELVQQSLREIVANEERIRVVGEAGSCEEALLLAANVAPDVGVLDVNLPDINGLDATKRFKKFQPQTIVIGRSFGQDEQMTRDMIVAGAKTLLSKNTAAEKIIATIVECAANNLSHLKATAV